jgi:hypothetical protein
VKEIAYTTYPREDKQAWGDGPWVDEPDKMQWQDADTGYPCLAVRGPSGSWCGYVGLSEPHPLHNVHYDHVPYDDVHAHGGLTYSDFCADPATPESWEKMKERARNCLAESLHYPRGDAARFLRERATELRDYDAYVRWHEGAAICHKVEDGEDDRVWWLGFDTAHSGDFCPKFEEFNRFDRNDNVYRDLAYVKDQVTQLAAQCKAFADKGGTAEKMTMTVAEHHEIGRAKLREMAKMLKAADYDFEKAFGDAGDETE